MASMIMNRTRRVGARQGRCERRPASMICPIDFSERGRVALRYAAEAARQRNGKLVVVHVLAEEAADGRGEEAALEAALYRLERFVPLEPGVRCEWVVLHGDVADQIVELADQSESPQIVLASRKGSAPGSMGRTAEQLLRRAPCPVVIVNEVDVLLPGQSLQNAVRSDFCACAAS